MNDNPKFTPWTKRLMIIGVVIIAIVSLYLKQYQIAATVVGGLLICLRGEKAG